MARTEHLIPSRPHRPIRRSLEDEKIREKQKGPPKPPARRGPELYDKDGNLIRALTKKKTNSKNKKA